MALRGSGADLTPISLIAIGTNHDSVEHMLVANNQTIGLELDQLTIGGKVLSVGGHNWLPQHEETPCIRENELCSNGIESIDESNALFLPFSPHCINHTATNKDVVSYKFSGGIMAAFTQQGERKVCHISIGPGQDCKSLWEQLKNTFVDTLEFKPTAHIPFDRIKKEKPFYVGCYGVLTRNNKAYSITVYKDPRDESINSDSDNKLEHMSLRVFSITKIPLSNN